MYNKLKDIVKQGCKIAPYAIFEYIDNDKDKLNSTYYRFFFDSFKNIELICNAIDIKAYTQAGALLRILIEQVSTLKLLLDNKNILDEYNKFAKLKLHYAMNDKDTIEEIKKIKKQYNVKCSTINFCNFGWLLKLGETNLSINTIIKRSNLDSFPQWRSFCNNFVHNSISFLQLNNEGINFYINNFIYNTAILYDHLLCLFHNLNGFNFIYNDIDYRKIFINQFNFVTQQRKKGNNK